jgi:uncharacterized membrane protein YtjA (UPF0391 family)
MAAAGARSDKVLEMMVAGSGGLSPRRQPRKFPPLLKCFFYMTLDTGIQVNGDSSKPILYLPSMQQIDGGFIMLNWAVTFFVIALIAALLGFTGIAVAAAGIAKLLFVVFLILFVVSLATHLSRRSSSV